MTLEEILRRSSETLHFSPEDLAELGSIELATDLDALQERTALFLALWPQIQQKGRELGIVSPSTLRVTFWRFWLPLAIRLRDAPRPFIQGILAPQGTGKTTLTAILLVILQSFGVRASGLSLDDLYKTHAERQRLRSIDPRLRWRGPPGTHDIGLGLAVLDRVRRGETPIALPRFNKALHQGQGDRVDPEIVEKIDILLFEGWFLGMRPVEATAFDAPPTPLDTPDDRQFARDSNERLRAYLPLWERLDQLLLLYPLDYRWSLAWRKAAEPAGGMKDAEIEEFVKYFWKSLHPELFLAPLREGADGLVEVNGDRSIGKIQFSRD